MAYQASTRHEQRPAADYSRNGSRPDAARVAPTPPRVLLIHQAFVSPAESGGTRHYELARHCLRNGQAMTIIASDLNYLTGDRTTTDRRLVSEQQIDGISVLRAFTLPTYHRSFVWRVLSFLSFMVTSVLAGLRAGPVDIVMGTSPSIFQAVSAWLVAVLRRRPFLLEIRDLWPAFAIGMGVLRNPFLIVLSYWLERFLYRQAAHLLVNSPAYRDYLIDRGVSADQITLIPNGVDPGMFDPQADGNAFRRRWDLADKFVVTYAGALGKANDIHSILRAAARLRSEPAIHFLLVGSGKEHAALQQSAAQQGLTNVTFTGALPKSEIGTVLAASDVCVATLQNIPMFRTTYPNKIFDYMAAGRPTVLGIDGVIRHVIEAAGGGIFVPPGDHAALAAAVQQLYANPAQVQAMGAAARTYVVEHFDRRHQAQAFVELVQQVAR